MIPAQFTYLVPESLDDAIALLQEHGSDAKLLAGGQSLIPAMRFRLAAPETLIDINRLSELEYIEAAIALGLPKWRILLRHVLPNILVPQIVLLTLDLPRLIVLEASIGFLGLGVQPPTPTLGNLIGEGRSYILLADWLILYPGLVIAALVIAFNLLGDWLIKQTDARVG